MRRGFSLVELSIVLVILGLLTGGILAGKSLLRAAQLRSVAADAGRYVAAFSTFRDQYGGLPGDLKNATKYWGFAGGNGTGNDVACFNTVSTDIRTCNGDGNQFLRNGYGDGTNTQGGYYELFRAWQHLASAELIEGKFTGTNDCPTSGSYCQAPGTNSPKSKYQNGGFGFYSHGYEGTYSDTQWYPGNYRNVIVFGHNVGLYAPLMPPGDAWNIDKKMDDGIPSDGSVMTFRNPMNPNCATSDDPAVAEYLLSYKGAACSFIFRTGY